MFKQFWIGISLLVLLTACGSKNSASRQNDFTPLTSMEIVAPSAIAVKTSAKLTVIGNFSGLFKRDITSEVTWATSAPAVADFKTPQIPSRVSGVAAGTATLTATQGTVKTTATLTVTSAAITTLTISPVTPSVPLGLTTQFAANGVFSDGTSQDLTFDSVWLSSTPASATVSDAVTSKGLAQTVALGTTTISATFDGKSDSTLLTVTNPALKSITVTPSNPSLLSLSTTTFKASGLYSDGTTSDITSTVTWASSQTGIATIAAGGIATALAQGNSTISASLPGVSGTTSLKVTGGNLTGFTLVPANVTLANGTASRIIATGTFNNGTTRDITGRLTWVSANPAVATVTAPSGNLVTTQAVATTAAQTNINALFGTTAASTTVTATTPTLTSLTISPVSTNLTVGASSRFTLSGTYSDGTTQDLTNTATWISGNPSSATAGNTGLDKGWVKGVAASSVPVLITASFGGLQINAEATTVVNRSLQSINTTGFPSTLIAGTQSSLIVTATYADGTLDVTKDAVFSVDNSNVIIFADSLNQPGTIVIVDSGKAVLTVNFGGLTQTFTITVP